jgi:hypothetical protein
MSIKDDRLVGDAAWALGEIVAANPGDKRTPAVVDRWLYAGKHGGWAGSINGAGALARLLWAVPAQTRAALLSGGKRSGLLALVFHKSRLVRINAALALGSLAGDADAAKALAQMLRDDSSAHARAAAARNLARVGGPRAAPALKAALEGDLDPQVKAAAKAAQGPVAAPVARTEWRIFYVVDPSADDAPVRQEQYFIHTPDGVVWASYTDARGELTSEHVPPGDAIVWPASREAEY